MGRNYLSAAAASEILTMLGFQDSPTNIKQLDVLVLALEKFVERNADYQDLWQEYGIDDSLLHIKSKSARLERLLKTLGLAVDLDDAVDLINYTVFLIRLIEAAQVFADQEAEGT